MFDRARVGVCLLLLLVTALPAAAQTGTTAIYFDSQPGDYIGQGLEQTWTELDLMFSASVTADRSTVTISAQPADFTFPTRWTLRFAGPEGMPLAPGAYESATRWPFHVKSLNGLDVSGSGRGCNTLVGRFRVHEVVINASGAVERFAADFEQHCEGRLEALYGAVRYRSTRASLVPFDGAYPLYAIHVDDTVNGYVTGPGIDCGAGRADCDETFGTPTTISLTAIPNPGYVFLGWTGFDCIGVATVSVNVNRAKFCRPVFNAVPGGPGVEAPNYSGNAVFLDGAIETLEVRPPGGRAQFAVVPPYGRVVLERATPTSVSFRLDHPAISDASVVFSAALNDTLAPGLYEPVAPTPYTTLASSMLLTYNNSSCFAIGGRFRIYEIAFEGPTLTAFSADFEAHCPGRTSSGSIRYNASRQSLLPFDGVYPSTRLFVIPTIGGYVTSVLGIDCGDGGRTDCEESFSPQSILSMQASASPGYQFLAWGGVCSGTAPIITITVKASGRCLALFHPITDVPSHPFGNEFLMIQRTGVTPSHTVWLPPDARLQVEPSGSSIVVIPTEAMSAFGGNRYTFTVPSGRVAVGEYDARAGTGFALQVPGCFSSRGFFKVYQAEYHPDGTVESFAADFEAYCSDSTYVAGAVRYRASSNVVVPFGGAYPVIRLTVARSPYGHVAAPGIACGPAAADCSETYGGAVVQSIQATPGAGYAFAGWAGDCSGGSFTQFLINRTTWCEPIFRATRAGLPEDPRIARGSLTIQSEPGEPIGGGILRTYFTDNWSVFAFDSRRHLTAIASDTGWRMEFLATAPLAVGSYEVAGGLVFPSVAPMLSISLFPRSCDPQRITGRFVIYELRFASEFSSAVESLALDFEQRCNNGPALRGSIRYRSSRSVLQPFGDEGHVFTRFDFTGDQSPDLVWQNANDGRLLLWYMSGISYAFNDSPSIPQVSDPNWQIVGSADADLDGYNDLYWQHQTSGQLAIWYMRDTQIVSTRLITQVVSDTNWQIRTVFDVDRDGQPDLLWQHRVSGHIAVWYMNNGAFRSSQLVGPGQIADPNWTIVGAGDANGDGRFDLFWHHPISGQPGPWYMDGVQLLSTTLLTPSSVADTNWRVRGIADLNRDGAPDVVWQNVSTSQVAVWMLSGSRLVESRLINGPTMPAGEWLLVGPR